MISKSVATSPSLSDRMKEYEAVFSGNFTRRTPVIIRLDGKAFHTWTKSVERPFDERLPEMFGECLTYLLKNIQGAVFGYAQSDEISIFLRDYDKVTTDAWFGANQQKMVSVAASLITSKFNQLAAKLVPNAPLAHFDARGFVIPKDEVVNYFIWRQNDAVRNSVQGYGQSILGHKECQGKNLNDLKSLVSSRFPDKGWETLPLHFQRGIAQRIDEVQPSFNIPLFKEDRNYIEELIYVKND